MNAKRNDEKTSGSQQHTAAGAGTRNAADTEQDNHSVEEAPNKISEAAIEPRGDEPKTVTDHGVEVRDGKQNQKKGKKVDDPYDPANRPRLRDMLNAKRDADRQILEKQVKR